MWIKKLPGIVANAAVLILDIFVILNNSSPAGRCR